MPSEPVRCENVHLRWMECLTNLSSALFAATLASCSEAPHFERWQPPPAALDDTPILVAGPLRPPLILHRTEFGGDVDAATLAQDCVGRVGSTPNHRLRIERAMPFLRITVFGRGAPRGESPGFTLVLVGSGSQASCATPRSGRATVMEGEFAPGDYELYVGSAGPRASGVYQLLLTSDPEVNETNFGVALVASTPGAYLYRASFVVMAESGDVVEVGDRCELSETAVGDGTLSFVWTLRCDDRVLYRAPASADRSEGGGAFVRDDSTSPIDGSPSLRSRGTSIVVTDVASGALGEFSIELSEVPYDPHPP